MANEYMNQALASKPIAHRYARTQRELLKLLQEQAYEQARWDLKKYISIIFNCDKPTSNREEYKFEFFHDILIEELLKFLFTDEVNRLMFLLPPRAGKSTIGSILLPTWIYGVMSYRVLQGGKKSPYRIMQSSYGDELLKKFIGEQIGYTNTKTWEGIFPQVRIAPKGGRYGSHFNRKSMQIDFVCDVGAEKFRETGGNYQAGCSVFGVPLQGSVTGFGANMIILDDMVKGIREADSPRIREETWKWWQSTLSTRLENTDDLPGKILSLNTRWHEDDLTARLEAEGDWKVIRFPALAYPEGHEYRDPRDTRKEGEVLSVRIKENILEQKKKLSKRHFSSLYQQTPVVEGGNIIKGEDIQFYISPPQDFDLLILSADMGFKGNKTEIEKRAKQELSYTVYEVWGLKDFTDFYLLEQRRGRWSFTEQEAIFLQLVASYQGKLGRILIEDAANAQALFSRLEQKTLNIELIDPKFNKELRLKLVSHLYEKHRVFYPSEDFAPWIKANIKEITAFPAHPFRDTVDVASQALSWLEKFCEENRVLSALGEM